MDYRQTYQTHLFTQSQCIWHENSMVDFIRSQLIMKGYQAVDDRRFVWQRGDRSVLIALVDDIEQLNYQQHVDFLSTLTKRDIVITDNWFARPVSARIFTLPESWFGIYACRPLHHQSVPTKAWSMPVNRIDFNRTMIMLEMQYQGHIDDLSLVNFNCARHTDCLDTADQRNLWLENWDNIDPYYKERYQASFDYLTPLMPFRNHDMPFDRISESALCQIVLETYVGDHSVALSEKTFRALITPRLWRVFGGTWTVARLRQLGMDVMDDVIDHDTDGLRMVEDKIVRFVQSCRQTWTARSWSDVRESCERAQSHNAALLDQWRRQWPKDFAAWWPGVLEQI